MSAAFELTLNGKVLRVSGVPPHTTLADYLRTIGLTGTKQGCSEGDCGACTVAVVETNARGERTFRAINSCITLLPMLAGREIVTVEGIGADGPHPIQDAMIKHYGSQCGYCTPGFVVSMFEGFYRTDLPSEDRPGIADQLCGNLCRCTGYRPIRDAMEDALSHRDERKNDLFQLTLRKPAKPLERFEYEHQGRRFIRPDSLDELLRLRSDHPEAVLVAGATEVGVDVTKKFARFSLLISLDAVPELKTITKTDEAWIVGGTATLTALQEALSGEIPALDKMLIVFASRQIRNNATLAGNLVTASPIGDMAPVMLALDAEIMLLSKRGERVMPLSEFFLGYRKTALEIDEIVRAIKIPRVASAPGLTRQIETYKVSKRRELDISIVAAAFRVDVEHEGIVRHARLAFGGVAATPIRALHAEARLVGNKLDIAVLPRIEGTLEHEFSPIDDVRSGNEYRRGLIVALFSKFLEGGSSLGQDEPLTYAPSAANPSTDPSHALHHDSALGHVTGAARYVFDEACRRPMLEMWPVMSKHAHGSIRRIDTSKARALAGVVAVLTAEDIPGENDVGAIRKDEPLLASDEVLFLGQLVAVVIGESIEICREAAALVEVDVEPRPAVLTIPHAIGAESFHTQPHFIRRGDIDAALGASPHTLSGSLEIGGQEHFYLETHAAWAEAGDDGDVEVTSSTQHPSEVQALVSHVLHIDRNRVVVHAPRMGGGFGGKETQGAAWAALCALASRKTGRAVRVMLDRDIDMTITGKRHPFYGEFEVGHDSEGRLLAARVKLYSDGGYALDLSESINDRGLFHLDNAYYIPAVEFMGRVCKTHACSHTAFRGFGGPQGMLVIEEILDRVARRLSLPPELVRERNLYRGTGESATTHYGQKIEDERIPQIWSSLIVASSFEERRESLRRWNEQSPRIKRGLAITPVKFGISFTASFLNQAGALVLVYRDGTAQVNHGGTEMGQGLYAKIQGIAMRELGLDAAAVRVMKTRTDKVPNTSATAASSGADLNGAAVKDACEKLRERLAPIACEMWRDTLGTEIVASSVRFEGAKVFPAHLPSAALSFGEVVERAYLKQVSLSATGFYRTPGVSYDKAKGRGKPFHYFANGAAVCEVEVDGYTGMKRVVRVDILHDVGESLNPGIDRGQVEGAFVQGLGWLTAEELKWDRKGRLLTHSASTYQIPAISDAPMDFRVTLMPDARQHNTVHGSKAVGEPPFMLAISVREAIRDAIAAFGARGGEVLLPSPATHEAIFLAIQQRLEPDGDLEMRDKVRQAAQ
ncbi:MAG: xanthine dehydrogenase molybdopterin binding subunit [Polyangiaceae bacterium]